MLLTNFLTTAQVETIHRNALRVLAEIGVQVEHEGVRQRLAAIGGQSDKSSMSVRFPAQTVERYICTNHQHASKAGSPTIRVTCGVYQCFYLDPSSNALVPFDELKLAKYIGLARSLQLIEPVNLLGVPFLPDGIPAPFLPLAEKLYAWKYGARPDGTIQHTVLCESLLEMFSCHASMTGKRLEDVVIAVGYMISPLRLARQECEQLLFFSDRGLKMSIGHLPSQGGSAPITLAGSITLALAEQIFLFLLQRAFCEDAVFRVGGDVMTMDMRKGVSCYGRPEQQRINMAFADIARFYGCPCYGHTGLSDAKLPSFEAGAQKASGALVTALAVGCGTIEAGLLSTDEVCSPIQMILDRDLAGSLRALLAEPFVNEAECDFDEILASGAGGNFLGADLTVQRCRTELYQPQTWSWQSVSGWLDSDKRIDVGYAKDIFQRFDCGFSPVSQISAEEESELGKIIAKSIATIGSQMGS
jgi:trimethylamine:corrinoid methyltransferase-like protein